MPNILRRVAMQTVECLAARVQRRGSAVCRTSSSDKRGKATAILSTGDFKKTVDRVTADYEAHTHYAIAKLPYHEAHHSSPSSIEVEKSVLILPVPHTSSWHGA